MEILKLLDSASFLKTYDVLDYKSFGAGFYIKIKAICTDESELHIREYFDSHERNYSWHWQNKQGEMISRWDNAPHHRSIPTFPHHRHGKDAVEPNTEIMPAEILNFIKSKI